MKNKVGIVGAGMTKFGVREATYRELIAEAGKACFDSLNGAITPKDVDGFILASVLPERNAFQSHVASLAEETLGIRPTSLSTRVEHMCASGNVAIRLAYASIVAGLAKTVMVVGVEKLNTPVMTETFGNMGAGLDREFESSLGLTAPPVFAITAQAHMRKYGTTEEQLAAISVKNREHASKNQNAHFRKPTTIEEALSGRIISSPLRLFDCSPITDGAAAVIITSDERARDLVSKPIYLAGSGQVVNNFTVSNSYKDLATWPALKLAAQNAFHSAGITARDVDIAEIHDCFSIAELMVYEEMGFCEKGEGGHFVTSGRAGYGGDVVVNPRGGLIGCGHPLGATGVAQACEIFWQLRGEAGERQVSGAKIGLTHNNSGPGEHVINIFSSEVL
ncbi:thiolase family protein [Neobacillus niacini]|uniref:thiolase family protein n=1 Tax=Neobacillus niacini TaxID=86668 RepID=UPI003000B867